MQALPETGFLRVAQIVGNRKNNIPAIIPVSPSTWWDGCRTGKFPRPVKLGKGTTVWRVEDIRTLIEKIGGVA
jgi:predicted DNA-binding transcriptional regulator AlpA